MTLNPALKIPEANSTNTNLASIEMTNLVALKIIPPILEATGSRREIRPLKISNMTKPSRTTQKLLYTLFYIGNKSRRKPVLFQQIKMLSEKGTILVKSKRCIGSMRTGLAQYQSPLYMRMRAGING
jgi:hypothetical protein